MEERRLIELPADWIRSGALVVGHLEIWMSGLRFRSLVPNPERSVELPIADIERAAATATHRFEVWAREHTLRFLTADPNACVLALEQALAVQRASTAYR